MGGGGEASGKGILVTHPSSLSCRAQAIRCLGECRFLSAPGLCTFVASGHWVNCSHVTFPVPQEGTNNQSHAVQYSNCLLIKLLGLEISQWLRAYTALQRTCGQFPAPIPGGPQWLAAPASWKPTPLAFSDTCRVPSPTSTCTHN